MSQSSNTGLTLQINSKEALERLLGGDEEMVVRLRHAIAVDFAKQHLATALSTEMRQQLSDLTEKAQKIVSLYIQEQQKNPRTWSPEWVLSQNVKGQIKAEVQAMVTAEITKVVEEQRLALRKLIDEEFLKLRNKVPEQVQMHVTGRFHAELREAVDRRLREIRDCLPSDPDTRKITV